MDREGAPNEGWRVFRGEMKSGFVRRREPPRRNINFFSFSPSASGSFDLALPLPPLVPRGSAASVDRSESFPTGRNFPTSSLYLLLSESLQKRASENLALSGYPANTGSFFREGGRYITSACPVSSIKLRTFIKRVIDRRLMSLSPNFVFSDCLPRRGTASKRWIRNSSHSRKFYSKGEGDKRR